jgi:hypothetical protein
MVPTLAYNVSHPTVVRTFLYHTEQHQYSHGKTLIHWWCSIANAHSVAARKFQQIQRNGCDLFWLQSMEAEVGRRAGDLRCDWIHTESHTPRGVLKKKGFHRVGVIQDTTKWPRTGHTQSHLHLLPNDRPWVTESRFLTAYHTFDISRQRVRVLLDLTHVCCLLVNVPRGDVDINDSMILCEQILH